MLSAMALKEFSLNNFVGGLCQTLLPDGINDAAQDTSTRTVRLYMWGISFLSYHFLPYDSERKTTSEKKVTSASYNFILKNLENMLEKEVKVFYSRNSLKYGLWSLSVISFQWFQCLTLPDIPFQTKYQTNSRNSFQTKCLIQSNFLTKY